MRSVSSRQNPLVAEYRALARRRPPGTASVLLEGAHLVNEALDAGLTVASAAVTREAGGRPEVAAVLERLAALRADTVLVTGPVMRAMSPASAPSGLVAIAELAAPDLSRAFAPGPRLVLVLFDVQDPGNAGAVVRSAEALGATAVIFCGASADPFGWKALRGSMGSAFRIPVIGRADPHGVIAAARAAGLAVVATVPAGGESVLASDLTGPTALLLGGEGPGLDPSIIAAADGAVSIPMSAPVESLNVAVAAAILLWEARRQCAAARQVGRG